MIVTSIVGNSLKLAFPASLSIFSACYHSRIIIFSALAFKSGTVTRNNISNPPLLVEFLVAEFIIRRKVPFQFRVFYYGFFIFTTVHQIFSCYNFYFLIYEKDTIAVQFLGWIVVCGYWSPGYFWIRDFIEKKEFSEFDYYEIIYFLTYGTAVFFWCSQSSPVYPRSIHYCLSRRRFHLQYLQ